MKLFNILFALLFVSAISQGQFKSARLQAAGLTCAMCTKAINESLKDISFIETIDVNIKESEFVLQFKPGADIDPDALKRSVEDAGFTVARLRLIGNFNNLELKKDAHINIEGKTFHFINAGTQTLNGEKTITVVDKNFVLAKEFKKYAAATSMACVNTGRAASCCAKDNIAADTRIYHVVL